MKCSYFCAQHAALMQQDEDQAKRAWNQFMQLGVQHYAHCRIEQACVYLHSALELALLRFECQSNQYFCHSQLCKPLDFLMQLLITEERYDEASLLLAKINASVIQGDCDQILLDSLGEHYRRLENSERQFLMSDQAQRQYM